MTAFFRNKSSETSLLELRSPTEFFHDLILSAQKTRNISLGTNVEFYVVNLLCEFVSGASPEFTNSLALTYAKAMESSHGDRITLLKQIGDNSLFVAGFFRDFFARKSFDIAYYISMGSGAYSHLSSLMRQHGKRGKQTSLVYGEMAESFSKSVEVLFHVAEKTFPNEKDPSENLLNTYEVWLDTASSQLENELREQGIVPVPIKKIMQ